MKRTLMAFLIINLGVGVLCGSALYVLSAALDYNPNLFPKGITDFPDDQTGYYRIDPETILASLERGETDVFVPALVPVPALVQPETVFKWPVSWHQADYLRITHAVFQSVWKEPSDSWRLLDMGFYTTCRDHPDGFERSDLYFFKDSGESEYATREVIIDLRGGSVVWGGGRDFPRFSWVWKGDFPLPDWGWESIDLNRVKIIAEDTLWIAEENGGRALRLAAENRCDIHISLSSENWWVSYISFDEEYRLYMRINPYTGKVHMGLRLTPTPSP